MNNYYFLNIKTYWFLFQSWKVHKSFNPMYTHNHYNIPTNHNVHINHIHIIHENIKMLALWTEAQPINKSIKITQKIRKKRWSNKEIKKLYWKLICKQKVRKRGVVRATSACEWICLIIEKCASGFYQEYYTYSLNGCHGT
jgi:hypothetical protein